MRLPLCLATYIRLVSYLTKSKEKPQKIAIFSLIIVCVTLLLFTWIIRGSLCKPHIKRGNTEPL
ncbi:Hok/Gef family protein [Photorhabdus luminescens]|uniref:Protein HokA n=1 Tax=Photorhabdus luminescens subsp. mexicana TaxID=2100167 RepID=A0A4R4JKE7_PHOLU|nr:protein HokA [Photorhabdus luminescens subsp. mexicana]